MKIATWSVRGLNKRLPYLCHCLRKRKPDFVALQEVRFSRNRETTFPRTEIKKPGYHVSTLLADLELASVAILVRRDFLDDGPSPDVRQRGLPGRENDGRLLTAKTDRGRISSVYVPMPRLGIAPRTGSGARSRPRVQVGGNRLAAAEQRNLTPSAFSRRMRLIEVQLGAETFNSKTKPVPVNPAILDMREEIEQVVGARRSLTERLQNTGGATERQIVLTSMCALSETLTPRLVRHLRQIIEPGSVRLVTASRDQCVSSLLTRTADMALVHRLADGRDNIAPDIAETVDIGHDRLCPYASPEAAAGLAVDRSPQGLSVILYPQHTYFRRIVEMKILPSLRRRYGIRVLVEVTSAPAISRLLMAEAAVGWLPESLAENIAPESGIVRLDDNFGIEKLIISAVHLGGARSRHIARAWAQPETHLGQCPRP